MAFVARAGTIAWVALGCAGTTPAAAPEVPGGPPACREMEYAAADLGFSLVPASPAVPRQTAALVAFLRDRLGGDLPAIEVELGEPGSADLLFGAAGREPCTLPDDRVSFHPADPPRLRLVRPLPIARERLASGRRLLADGRAAEARADLQAAIAVDPTWHEALPALGDAYAAEGRFAEAADAYRRALAESPWRADVHERLGRALLSDRRAADATAAFQSAVALRPDDARIRRAAEEGLINVEFRPPVLPPAAPRETAAGPRWIARHDAVGAKPDALLGEARAYASCKHAFRASEGLRAAATAGPVASWRWSVAEEDVCTALWLSAYAANRASGRRPPDPHLEELIAIAEEGALSERSLFDVGARVHPYAAVLLPAARRERVVGFVARHRIIAGSGTGWLGP